MSYLLYIHNTLPTHLKQENLRHGESFISL